MGLTAPWRRAQHALVTGIPILIARAMHETLYNNPLIAAYIRTLEKLGVEWANAFRAADSGRQVYAVNGFS